MVFVIFTTLKFKVIFVTILLIRQKSTEVYPMLIFFLFGWEFRFVCHLDFSKKWMCKMIFWLPNWQKLYHFKPWGCNFTNVLGSLTENSSLLSVWCALVYSFSFKFQINVRLNYNLWFCCCLVDIPFNSCRVHEFTFCSVLEERNAVNDRRRTWKFTLL